VSAVLQWLTPANVHELRGFLGLASFYRRFVRHFAILAKPLTQLLKKHKLFVWTDEHQKAFEALQQALCSALVLGIPNFAKAFCIEIDACQSGVGVWMKMLRIFSDRIRDRIRLEWFKFVRIRVRIFNIRYRIRIRILKSYIYDVDIQSYPIRHG
jgi:hypothetical protein